jgi:hypothetical protein
MPNFIERMMSEGMASDYDQIQALSKKVYDIVAPAKEIRITTPAGTDLTAKFDPKYKWIVSDGNITAGHWSNLPDGEVFTQPVTADGTVVVDGCFGDFFNKKYGDIAKTPLTYVLEGGRCQRESVRCDNAALKEEFEKYTFESDENSDRLGEFAIGTNVGLTGLIGNLLQDEKFPGIHLALGSPYPDKTGAPDDHRRRQDDHEGRRVPDLGAVGGSGGAAEVLEHALGDPAEPRIVDEGGEVALVELAGEVGILEQRPHFGVVLQSADHRGDRPQGISDVSASPVGRQIRRILLEEPGAMCVVEQRGVVGRLAQGAMVELPRVAVDQALPDVSILQQPADPIVVEEPLHRRWRMNWIASHRGSAAGKDCATRGPLGGSIYHPRSHAGGPSSDHGPRDVGRFGVQPAHEHHRPCDEHGQQEADDDSRKGATEEVESGWLPSPLDPLVPLLASPAVEHEPQRDYGQQGHEAAERVGGDRAEIEELAQDLAEGLVQDVGCKVSERHARQADQGQA